ncbi:MAG: PspC domain-containing protein [Fimbriimonadaceae bacterium]|nr:PspC domain-containing protein [Chitinophagales bacterium]
MNKLLYVNIGGVVFQIDETAYNKLDNYLNSIRKKYASAEDGDEIIHDIENRIAELFHEKVGEKGAINIAHVEEIISVMGRPEDFGTEQTQEKNYDRQETGRHRGTRFYRDKENDFLGGVCAGFAAKFDIDVLWIRLAFLIAFFIFGTGLLLYIILWIIMPEAKTTADKLEMRGERVNIDNIERTVKDGAQQFKKKANEFGEELKETFSKERIDKTKRNAGDFIESAAETIKPVIKTIFQVFAGIILLICLVILVVLGIELISDSGEINASINFLGTHVIGDGKMSWILIVSALSLFIIPVAGILFSVSKYLLGIKKKFRGVSISLGMLWVLALTAVIFIAIKLSLNFREEATMSRSMEITQPSSDILYVQLNTLHEEKILWHKDYKEDWVDIVMHDDSAIFKNIGVEIEMSTDTNYAIIITKSAKGNKYDEAKTRATEFDFMPVQNDTLLQIPGSVILKEYELWRDQEVDVTIRVPQNKYIMLDSKLDRYMDDRAKTGLTDDALYGRKLMMTAGGLK